jgi:DNA-binding transcriptional LysR family regulator
MPGVELQVLPAEAAEAPALLPDRADAGLVRLPVDRDAFHAIPLYTEVTVVVVPRDHLIAAADTVTVADLAEETLLRPLDDVLTWAGGPPGAVAAERPPSTAAAVELVAAGGGVLVVPQSLARAHSRRDLTYRPVTDAPTSSVGLAWPRERHTDLVEEMIGVVRGRTANSTRGRAPGSPATTGRAERGTAGGTPSSGRPVARRGGTTPRRPPRRRGR